MEPVIGVIPKDLATGLYWPQIAALVEQAMPYGRGEYEIEDVHHGIEAEQLFAIGTVDARGQVQSVLICSCVIYPRKKVLFVIYGAGRGASFMQQPLVAAAKTLGADWIESRCRLSVAELFRRAGFEIGYCVPVMELS